jgi:hypothetical protein
MALSVTLIEPDRWGAGKRLPRCLEYLARYGMHARAVVPRLEEVRRTILESGRGKEKAEQVKRIDECLAGIAASTDEPTIVNIGEFTSREGSP